MPTRNRRRACVICRVTFEAARLDQWRCPSHQLAYDRTKDAQDRQARPYDHAERLEHEAMVTAWIQANGLRCPGLQAERYVHLPHPVRRRSELTVHHLETVAEGGRRVGGPKTVICTYVNAGLGGAVGGTRSRP